MRIVIGMNRAGKRRDADERQRYLIIAYLADGARSAAVAQRLGCARATVVRVALHFLPPYCPTVNRIERLWLDLHAVVTRNHRCATIEALLAAVADWLTAHNHTARQRTIHRQEAA